MIRTVRRVTPLVFLTLLLASAALVARPAAALAVGPDVELTAEATGGGGWTLQARVTGADGSALSQVDVTLVMATDFFGDRWIPLGTGVTSTSGVATFAYAPTSTGDQSIVARAATSEGSRDSRALVIHVESAVPAVPAERATLPIVRAWALPVGIGVVVLVWIVLGAIFVFAVLGIARQPSGVDQRRPVISPTDRLETLETGADGGSDP